MIEEVEERGKEEVIILHVGGRGSPLDWPNIVAIACIIREVGCSPTPVSYIHRLSYYYYYYYNYYATTILSYYLFNTTITLHSQRRLKYPEWVAWRKRTEPSPLQDD